jgi:hypothetical protein
MMEYDNYAVVSESESSLVLSKVGSTPFATRIFLSPRGCADTSKSSITVTIIESPGETSLYLIGDLTYPGPLCREAHQPFFLDRNKKWKEGMADVIRHAEYRVEQEKAEKEKAAKAEAKP